MRTTRTGTPFLVIGENIHATRVVLRTGKHIVVDADGLDAIRFTDPDGEEQLLAIPREIRDGQDFGAGKVKHVRAAILAGMSDRERDAADGRAYLQSMARRQEAAGADWLDLNVDEVSPDLETQKAAMRWLVRTVEQVASVPIALDSSNADVIAAGLQASRDGTREAAAAALAAGPAGLTTRPLLNSASKDRTDVLELAAAAGCPVIVTAAGGTAMPTSAGERVVNASAMIERALALGMPLGALHVDNLVLPVAVDPEVGTHFIEAVRRLRETFGPELHLTGGFSNVSFGLPLRRLLNDVFIDLAVEAGADSGIVDPIASDLGRVFALDRGARAYALAADLLLGRDPYGGAFMAAYRAGEIEVAVG